MLVWVRERHGIAARTASFVLANSGTLGFVCIRGAEPTCPTRYMIRSQHDR